MYGTDKIRVSEQYFPARFTSEKFSLDVNPKTHHWMARYVAAEVFFLEGCGIAGSATAEPVLFRDSHRVTCRALTQDPDT
jgi:hypothetical protein